MKKALATLLVIMMVFSLSSCGENQSLEANTEKTHTQSSITEINDEISNSDIFSSDTLTEMIDDISTEVPKDTLVDVSTGTTVTTVEELETVILQDTEEVVNGLIAEWQMLSESAAAYDIYLENAEKIEEFYEKIINNSEEICIKLQEYAVYYAELIMCSDMSNDDKYDAFGDLYDCIYDDACDEIYDEIYDGILDDMYDAIYDGVLDDAYDNVPYDEWSDARSDEYDWWSDARSDVYDAWSDARSNIYDFWSDIRSDLWDDDIKKAEKTLLDYKSDVEKIKK